MNNLFHVMIVEDNAAHAELIKRGLEATKLKIKLVHFINGEQALDYLNNCSIIGNKDDNRIPDLILLDIRLPRVSGLEVLRITKSMPVICNIPIVILTSSTAKQDVDLAHSHHANSYLVKPAKLDQFMKLMCDTVNYWLVWNRKPWQTE